MQLPTREKTEDDEPKPPDIRSSEDSMEPQTAVRSGRLRITNLLNFADEDAEDEDNLPLATRRGLVRSASEKRVADVSSSESPDVKRHRWEGSSSDSQSNPNGGSIAPSPSFPSNQTAAYGRTRPSSPRSHEHLGPLTPAATRDLSDPQGPFRLRTMVPRVSSYGRNDQTAAAQYDWRAGTCASRANANLSRRGSSEMSQPSRQNGPVTNQQPADVGESLGYVRPRGFVQSSNAAPRFYRGIQSNLYPQYQGNQPNHMFGTGYYNGPQLPSRPAPVNRRLPGITVTDVETNFRRHLFDPSGTMSINPIEGHRAMYASGVHNRQDVSGTYLTLPGTRRPTSPQPRRRPPRRE